MSDTGTPAPAVLITGSSTGIGQACALALDSRGFRVFAGVRQMADGDRLREAASPRLTPVLLDVTDAAAIERAAATIGEATGGAGLAGLVNNAGITVAFPLEFLPLAELRRQLEVNVIGQLAVTQAMLPHLRAARGRIVNVGSISGRMAAPYVGAYAASKHALEALSDSLRVELRHFGIRVSLIQPADVDTPIWTKSRAAAEKLREEMQELVAARIPQEVRDCYAADITAMRAAVDRMAAQAIPVERIVRAVQHALTARRPRTRYPVGIKSWAASHVLRHFPDVLRDWIVCRNFGMK
jgi:NAD(P)-dependent dehydrogenase (short-subunit alcohol dehydrogenase family)